MKLTRTEEHLWSFINHNIKDIPLLSITELSEKANVSTATIVRTLKKLGYKGFSSFKYSLTEGNSDSSFYDLELANKKIERAIIKNKEEAERTLNSLDSLVLEDAVQKIFTAKRIIILARGLSEYVAEEMSLKLRVLNKYTETYYDPNIIITKSKEFKSTDLVIFVSLSGKTKELVTALKNCVENEISTIAITANKNTEFAKLAEITLNGYKSPDTNFPEYEVHSRLPLNIISRILVDAHAIRQNDNY